ncbi:uncharacterized protein LOC110444840 [Mizuhopecten yessoensis]|uniref:Uncharacterized protein n=1 Tax=Mizuhopecten yessoensis TaxID=6573 RepID=A0A210PHW2_MIZYE|nr:uncharacterized protein LOC110444840 [Mizuhopecten yessoensis]OWF36078.1 hypothetical protein KP79_PYT07640 [Mizuhopecten yessoensis]
MAQVSLLFLILTVVIGFECVLSQMKSCDCSCSNLENALENDPVLKAKMEKLAKEMTVDVRNTSSHMRSLTSATDDRPSAQAAGYVGVTILCLVLGLLLFFDGIGIIAQDMVTKQQLQ